MALLCFDVDGTLDMGDGPIPLAALHTLAQEHMVVIVSPSPLRPKDAGFPQFLSVDRKKNLLDAQEAHSSHGHVVYISDNPGDDHLSAEVGFEYVHPRDFTRFLVRLGASGPSQQ